MFTRILREIEKEISASQVMKHLLSIHSTDQSSSYEQFGRSAEYCGEALHRAGLENVETLAMKADGRTAYGDWVIPQAWDPVDAELRIVQPRGAARCIARYGDEPRSLFMYSASTPPEGVEAELVAVADRSELAGVDARGKILLAACRPGPLLEPALEKGVVGIVSDYQPELAHVRDRHDLPRAVRWENDCFVPRNVGGLFGFSLSPHVGEYLRDLAHREHAQGRTVRLLARVDARLYDGEVPVVSALIPGREPQEVLIDTHLYEPGANDNASGCAVSLELARSIIELIHRGDLPSPRRGIRFLFGWECAGFMGYATLRRERIRLTVAGLNMDTIGGSQDRNRCSLHLVRAPHSTMSCTNLLLREIAVCYQREFDPLMRWEEKGCGISASIYADPSIGVLTSGLQQWPDMTWHTSADGVERIDRSALKRAAVISGAYLCFLADAGSEEAAWLALSQRAEAVGRLEAMTARLMAKVETALPAGADALDETWGGFVEDLQYSVERELSALRSTLRLAGVEGHEETERQVRELASDLATVGRKIQQRAEGMVTSRARRGSVTFSKRAERSLTEQEKEAHHIIPIRKIIGPLTFFPLLGENPGRFRWDPYYNYSLNCPLYWADGQRTLLEISRMVRRELGSADLGDLLEYMRFLSERGYVELKRSDSSSAG